MANLSWGPHPSGLSRMDHKMHWPKMTVQEALGCFLLVFIFIFLFFVEALFLKEASRIYTFK